MTASPWLLAAGAAAGAAAGLALLAPTRVLLRRHDADPRWCSTPVAAAAVALTAALCAALTWPQPYPAVLAAALCLAVVAAPLAIIDLAVQRLPDLLVVPCYAAVTAALATHAVYSGQWRVAVRAGLAAAGLGVAFLLIAIVADGQMGLGDVKLAGLIGLVVGGRGPTSVLAATLAAFTLAAITGLVLILARRASMRTRRPFGPYLLAGALLVLLA